MGFTAKSSEKIYIVGKLLGNVHLENNESLSPLSFTSFTTKQLWDPKTNRIRASVGLFEAVIERCAN